jgi:hypothetical protein
MRETVIERVLRLANQKIADTRDPSLARRLASAVEIVLEDGVYPLGNGFYRVISRSREGISYQVAWGQQFSGRPRPEGTAPIVGYCECEDHTYRDITCSHRLAAWLLSESIRGEVEESIHYAEEEDPLPF